MTKITVSAKHAGKSHPVLVDTSDTGLAFKQAVYDCTGVPTDRMKVMVKGGMLKDEAILAEVGLKEGQVITIIGTAGPLPTGPSKQTIFLEDMDARELAIASSDPPGLVNLGQTCYLNSSLQVLRAMPQLREALTDYQSTTSAVEAGLTQSVQRLFTDMTQTTQPIAPFLLLNNLRRLAPQFAEQDRSGGFAQQDADEAWTQLVSALRSTLSLADSSSRIDQLMSIGLHKTLTNTENEQEQPSISTESVLKLECNISGTTNFLASGILDVGCQSRRPTDAQNLDQQIEKTSPTLGRAAVYQQKTRISRLPTYLAIHMVRFYWRRDIQKKAKIMRKVKFPLQLDMLDMVEDEMRSKVQAFNTSTRQILKERDDRAKIAKRNKGKTVDGENETDLRERERASLEASIAAAGHESGTNPTAIYELCAMVTHKGASADSGHYIGWTRKEDSLAPSGEEEWYKFDDDKVTTVTADKILNMDGGGEDSVAYILLYRPAIV